MSDRQPVVFLSAVTAELGDMRDALAKTFADHGARVRVQRNYPSDLSDGPAIQEMIDSADLVVCLIGYRYGAELPPGKRPPEAHPDCSWTQWEYWYARARARERRLFLYNGPPLVPPEAQVFADRQIGFRTEIEKVESAEFGGAFFRYFDRAEKLAEDVTRYLENLDGALAKFQEATWRQIEQDYRAARIEAWTKDFPNVYAGPDATSPEQKTALMAAAQPPFIASQAFFVLVPGPNGEQSKFLKPAGFLPGRDSESEASARADSEWRRVKREEIVAALRRPNEPGLALAGVALPQPRRLFLISGGGVGKTTNMRWLEAMLCGPDPAAGPPGSDQTDAVFAVLVSAEKLVGAEETHVLAALNDKIAHEIQKGDDAWARNAIAAGLVANATSGRLLVLIDGLDHVEDDRIRLLASIQSRVPAKYWASCGVVAAGRPQAIQGWEDAPANTEKTVSAGGWRFLEPAEFEPHEAAIFLGTTDGESRYELVDDKLAKLIQVPRVLEYVRSLPKDQLVDVRTSADIYDKATRELVKRTLREGGEPARMIGPDWQQDRERAVPRSEQIDYVMKILSALAYIALCPTVDPLFRVVKKSLLLLIDSHVKDALWARLAPNDATAGSESRDLARDLRALAAFASILGNGLMDATDTDSDTLRSVVWSNRTIHQYLAAYWLAKHARGLEAYRDRLAGKPELFEADDLNRDTDRFRCYLFYPEADYLEQRYESTDVTYELNQFLAEMPVGTISAESWVAAAQAWYDPAPLAELGDDAPPRTWSAEMLYRSWPTMLDIAGRPFDDWWDLPYEKLTELKPGMARARASLHGERQAPQSTARAASVAATVIKRFFADFDSILAGAHGPQPQAVAKEMIAEENWIAVPGGSFDMGTPPEKQGFPCKVQAYWLRDLDDVSTGRLSAKAAAERSTKAEWFTGAQGKRLRAGDIEWLTDTYRPLEPQPCTPPVTIANRQAPDYQHALKALESKWSRKDETPLEKTQAVAGFAMHRFPILHRWFRLFSPGHADAVESYLGAVPMPADDNPVIYISWYDAWAFCQWATWTVEDATAPKGKRRYGLRLPHEPEWEYAAGWSSVGSATPIPYGQRYWWGDHFYRDENSPIEEPLSEAVAHAIGAPGRTRAPAKAAPNGFGFCDTLGNVWEWTANPYDLRKEEMTASLAEMHYSRIAPTTRPPVNCPRTMRGGLWYYLDVLATCQNRFRLYCDDRDYKMGFRAIREERPLT